MGNAPEVIDGITTGWYLGTDWSGGVVANNEHPPLIVAFSTNERPHMQIHCEVALGRLKCVSLKGFTSFGPCSVITLYANASNVEAWMK